MTTFWLQRRAALVLGIGLLTAFSSPGLRAATSLQPKLIPADAAWFVQADFERLKQTQLGQAILRELDRPAIQNRLTTLQSATNFDPRKNLTGGAVYGWEFNAKELVILAQGDIDTDQILSLLAASQEHQSTTHGNHLVHSWPDKGKAAREGGNPRTYASVHTNGTVIVSPSTESVNAALDVLDKAKPSLEGDKNFAGLGELPASAFLVVGASQVQLPRIPPQVAAVLKEIKALRLVMSETEDQVQLDLQLLAPNEDTARNFKDILQGVKATLTMLKENPVASQIAPAATIAQAGAKVTVTIKAPSDKVAQLLKTAVARRGGLRPAR